MMRTSEINTLYWVAGDRVLIDDVTRYGLHRKHVVRSGGMPDIETWRQAFPQADSQVYMDQDGTGHLWLYWKKET